MCFGPRHAILSAGSEPDDHPQGSEPRDPTDPSSHSLAPTLRGHKGVRSRQIDITENKGETNNGRKGKDVMQEYNKMEEILSEEMLNLMIGSRADPSFFKCISCAEAREEYMHHMRAHNASVADAQFALGQGNHRTANMHFSLSHDHQQLA